MLGQARESGGFGRAAACLLGQLLLAAAAYLAGMPWLLALCLMAWPAAAWLRERHGWLALALPCAASVGCVLASGAEIFAFWCWGGVVALAAGMKLPQSARPRWMREAMLWGGMAAVTLCALIILLNVRYPQGIGTGLAADMIAAIDSSPNSAEMLYQFYQMGVVALENGVQAVEIAADGMAYMSEEVRLQLLYGLHSRLEEALQLAIPGLVVYFGGLTTLGCVALPTYARRRRGEKVDMPRFERWHLERETGLRIGYLFVGGLLPVISDAPVLVAMGQLTSAAAGLTFSVLGAATLRFSAKQSGRGSGMTWAMILLAAVWMPQLLMFLGVIDQLMDMRKLRKTNEMEDDRE